MKILITGAHFTPAVAVSGELLKNKGVQIVYVGRKSTQEGDNSPSAESKVLPSLGIKFVPIIAGRLQRSFTVYTIYSLLKIPIGFLQAFFIIFKEKPNVILSFGGYVAVPVVIAGWLLSIPIIIHEQTLVSGLANKISSIFADKIAVSFPSKNPRAILTGNPIRKEIQGGVRLSQRGCVIITGGNQGSHTINLAVEKAINKLTKLTTIIHVTGDSKFKDFERLEKLQSEKYVVKKWIGKEWGPRLQKADLVVSRAGINTLSELAYLGIPALIIPIPYSEEQKKNAEFFQELGLLKILPQAKLSSESLFENIKKCLKDLDNLKMNAKNAKKVIIPDAAKRLALETLLLGS